MAGHFLLSPASRDFTIDKVDRMSAARVHAYFAESRWGSDGTQVCPGCGTIAKHYFVKTRMQWRCREVACGRAFSVTTDTKFSDRKLPLKTILKGMVLYVTNVKGISACALSRQLGVAYQTAFILLHKLRESIVEHVNKTQLDGLIHIDGAHISGRIRKPRKKKKATQTQARAKIGSTANPLHPNRRIIMVMREVDPIKGKGATRTIVEVVPAENEHWARELAKQYIKKGATIMSDEHPAYGHYMARFNHLTVNHSEEFSTDDGVNNNQAESFFSRFRRMVWGQVHRITPKYMFDYATEVAWREDVRRVRTTEQVRSLMTMTQKATSAWWKGYWQGNHRDGEVIYVPAAPVQEIAG